MKSLALALVAFALLFIAAPTQAHAQCPAGFHEVVGLNGSVSFVPNVVVAPAFGLNPFFAPFSFATGNVVVERFGAFNPRVVVATGRRAVVVERFGRVRRIR